MGSDADCNSVNIVPAVSIHAPTWGATNHTFHAEVVSVFQSTLPHGERHRGASAMTSSESFNPRSHMGSDGSWELQPEEAPVSIHAPTWGATLLHLQLLLALEFQSTLPHGERQFNRCTAINHKLFQSTLPHGERRRYGKDKITHKSFNPRSHMGSDSCSCHNFIYYRCFNPRSHMGSDILLLSFLSVILLFQSTLPHGERLRYISF